MTAVEFVAEFNFFRVICLQNAFDASFVTTPCGGVAEELGYTSEGVIVLMQT
jgi:hypothetical protein